MGKLLPGLWLLLAMFVLVWTSGCAKKPPEVPSATGSILPTPTPTITPTVTPTPIDGNSSVSQIDEYYEGFGSADEEAAAFNRIENIPFEYDSSELSPRARRLVEEAAAYLRKMTKIGFIVEGHCDERGTPSYNIALGQRRAEAVRDYLLRLGIASERLSPVSFGEEKPLRPGQNDQAYALNRRVQFAKMVY